MDFIKLDDIVNLLYYAGELKNNDLKVIPPVKARHGSCCCCSDCGHFHDDCVCRHNQWVEDLINLKTHTARKFNA